jgi:type IV pilus assembly protein PilV
MNKRRDIQAPRQAAGFTLVESLVAMVVISVGMLGIAAMYVEGLRAGRTSIYRTAAVDLAADMADRIRANPNAQAAYAGAAAANGNGCVNAAANLSAATQAGCDLFFWGRQVATLLPGGAAAITFAAGAGGPNSYTITLNWNEPGVDGALQYALAVQL